MTSEAPTGVEAFNLGTGRGVSVLELIQAFAKASGKSIPFKVVHNAKSLHSI